MAIPMNDIAMTTRLQCQSAEDIVFCAGCYFVEAHGGNDDSWCEDCEYSSEEPGCGIEVLCGEARVQGGNRPGDGAWRSAVDRIEDPRSGYQSCAIYAART